MVRHDNATMPPSSQTVWLSRLLTFALAALAAGSGVFWALQWSNRSAVGGPSVESAQAATVDASAVSRALGGGVVAPASVSVLAATRFTLAGVVAGRSENGAALIAIDGKPPKPYAVGAAVEGEWFLRSVAPRRAVLATSNGSGRTSVVPGSPEMVLELPALNRGKNSQ